MQSAMALLGQGISANALRPYIDDRGDSRVLVGNSGRSIKANAPASLRYDEWKDIDRTVVQVTVDRLVAVADLIGRGLTHRLGSIGATIALWDKVSDMTPAGASMDGTSRGEEDTLAFQTDQVPVPIIHKDFRLNFRRLEASRRMGEPLDTTASAVSARLVAEKTEDMLFAGEAIVVDGASIYGYTTHPNRNTVDLAEQWSASGTTGLDILEDVQAMLAAARADGFYGPFVLYIPGEYEAKLDDDYNPTTSDTRTIRQRILQLNGIAEIKVADRLDNHNVILVQLTKEVVDMAIAQDVTTVQWEEKGGMQKLFKVMAVWVPRIKATYDGSCGIVHLRAA